MGIRICFSGSIERLADRLCDAVAREQQTAGNPFAETRIIVPNPNLAKWLTFRIAERNGAAVNLHFSYLEDGLRDLLSIVAGDPTPPPAPDPTHLQSAVAAALMAGMANPVFRPLAEYCAPPDGLGFSPGRRECVRRCLQLAGRLGSLFREYEFHREPMVEEWLAPLPDAAESGDPDPVARMEACQRALYREVLHPDTGLLSRLGVRGFSLKRLADEAAANAGAKPGTDAFPPVHLFGLSRLSGFHCRLLYVLAARAQLRLYHFNVCSEFWEDVSTPAEDRWRRIREAAVVTGDEDEELDLSIENSLLKAWGKAGRETVKLLADLEEGNRAEPPEWPDESLPETTPRTVLEAVQSLIARRTSQPGDFPRMPPDRSLQIAGCPGPYREIETVHDSILANLADDTDGPPPALTDIAILVPDMATYRPVIGTVFDGRGQVPYNLVDTTAAEDSLYGRALLGLLDLADRPLTRKAVFDLAANPCIQAAAGATPDDVARWLDWANALGIFRDSDAADPPAKENGPEEPFTWAAGLRRLRLGRILEPTDADAATGTPYDRFPPFADMNTPGREADRFVEFAEKLTRTVAMLRGGLRPCAEWAALVEALAEELLRVPADRRREETVRLQLLNALDELAGRGDIPGFGTFLAQAGADDRVSPAFIREFLAGKLSAIPSGKGAYLTGGVTIASFLPMRPIPFRIVYVVGLGEGLFPGSPDHSSLDLRLRRRRIGDVSLPDANRYLFLENLMAVRSKLYLTYVNRDLRKDEELFPSSVIKQLTGFLRRSVLLPEPDGSPAAFPQASVPLRRDDPVFLTEPLPPWTDLPQSRDPVDRLLVARRLLTAADGVPDLRAAVRNAANGAGDEIAALADGFLRSLPDEPAPEPDASTGPETSPPAGGQAEDVIPIRLRDLARFLRDPAAACLQRHLGLRDEDDTTVALAEDEPLAAAFPERYRLLIDSLTEYVAAGDADAARRRLTEAHAQLARRAKAPGGLFRDLDAELLAEILDARLGGKDGTPPAGLHPAGTILRDVTLGDAAPVDRPPHLRLPDVDPGEIPVRTAAGARVLRVRLAGSLPLLVPDGADGPRAVVVTDASPGADLKAEGGGFVPTYHVFEPLLFFLAGKLLPPAAGGEADRLFATPRFAVDVIYRKANGACDIRRWCFAWDAESARTYLRTLLTDYLSEDRFDLLPYDVCADMPDDVRAFREGRDPEPGFAERLQQAIEEDAESFSPAYRRPGYVDLAPTVRVPDDAERLAAERFRPIWQAESAVPNEEERP